MVAKEAPEKQNQILIITLIFSIIACVAVALRCYVRTKLLRAFGPDDVLAVCSLFVLGAGVIITLLGVDSGFGQHINGMKLDHFIQGLKYWCFAEIIYPPTIAVIKSSIALYLVRIAVKPRTFKSQTRTKTAVAITLALGSIASVCTLTRISYIKDLLDTHDYLYAISNVITLTIVEAAVGLTASCLATLKPLIRSFLDWSEKSMHSTGALHTRMMDGIGLGRTKLDDTELHLRPDLKIIGFTTTVISSNGRESPPTTHTSLSQPVDDKGEAWYTPHGSPNSHMRPGSGNGLMEAAEPAYHIR
ncbi:hypothetical protein DID88_002355 [Monilinia fructigena]|uniref:Rhodopsin domain-containing protein n=1 Tax=Monilinia fructigena TaxID=38457 RepID=A0A395IDA9_9HELO|nr:hypothetical protein DID88_002355 [Monilinia fructigena]